MQPLRFRLVSTTAPINDIVATPTLGQDGQGLLLWAIRIWATGNREAGDVTSRLRAAFELRGAGEAFVALRELLTIAWHSASRPLNVAAPGAAQPSSDERCLLAAIRHAEGGDLEACRRTLAMLLCPLGARTAVLPAWGLARALASLQADAGDNKPARPPLTLVR